MEKEKYKIVILDGYTAARDDLNWNGFGEFGEVSAYERTTPDLAIERAKDADIVITNKVVLGKEQLAQLPKLKYVGIIATGYNNVDLADARARGIDITNVPAYGTESVAQCVFAHILNIANRVEEHSIAVHRGAWAACSDICFCLGRQTELAGLTLGIVGYGAIGRKVAKIALGFDMKVLAYSPHLKIGDSDAFAKYETLDTVFSQSDIISLNCPLTDATKNIVNRESIEKMKDGVWIINIGRGGLINELALLSALHSGKVAAAGLDVLSKEPPTADNLLSSEPHCHITPHNAWTTFAARKRLLDIALSNLRAWTNGKKQNVVN